MGFKGASVFLGYTTIIRGLFVADLVAFTAVYPRISLIFNVFSLSKIMLLK